MYECFAYIHMCVCTMCMPSVHESQKRMKDSIELELHTVVNQHIGAGS